MKKILITGANSYIGTTFEKWIKENADDMHTDTLDMKTDDWGKYDFSSYDVVFHVAGIAHADVGNVSEERKALYYKVNCDLAVECAKIAKESGVGQFIFMSSIIVYGESAGIGQKRVITRNTPLTPANFYGDSKAKAEEGLTKLIDDSFKVVILRPPMIYGKGSRGNYPILSKYAHKLPLFPNVDNERSMLYVGNLCKFICLMIENEESGVFFPQNNEYVRTADMVKEIANVSGKKIVLTPIFNPLLKLMGNTNGKMGGLINKAFGNLVYDKGLSNYKEKYAIYDFHESIRMTEMRHWGD